MSQLSKMCLFIQTETKDTGHVCLECGRLGDEKWHYEMKRYVGKKYICQ